MSDDSNMLKQIEDEVIAILENQFKRDSGASILAFQISTLSVRATRLFLERYEKHLIEKIKNEIK